MKKFYAALMVVTFAASAQAAPISSNVFGPGSIAFNPSSVGASANPIGGNGITISGGYNYGYVSFGSDQSYLDSPGAITLLFSSPTSGFGFDFTSNNVDVVVSAYDATDALMESYTFSAAALPTTEGYPTGYAGFTGLNGITRALVTTSLGHNSIYIGTVTAAADVPEPGMLSLVGLAAIGLGLSRRRKS